MSENLGHVERSRASRERLRRLVERLSDAELGRSLGGDRTVASTLLHVAFWDRRAAAIARRWQRLGVGPSEADVHAVNDALLPQALLVPPRAAAGEAVAAAESADGVMAALAPELRAAALGPDTPFLLDRSPHRLEHLEEIEAALRHSPG